MIRQIVIKSKVEKYSRECKGRNYAGNEVFDVPVNMNINVWRVIDSKHIHVDVGCCYNTGGHGQRCKAAHPHIEKNEDKGVLCPYSFDLPYGKEFMLEHKRERALANKDLAEIAKKEDSLLHPYKHLFE